MEKRYGKYFRLLERTEKYVLFAFVVFFSFYFYQSWFSPSLNTNLPMKGWIDKADETGIKGWICVKGIDPSQVHIRIYVKDRLKETLKCDLPRPDISISKHHQCSNHYVGFESSFSITNNRHMKMLVYVITDPPRILPFPNPVLPAVHRSSKDTTYLIEHKKPLSITITSQEPVRLNILISSVKKDILVGSVSIFHFAYLASRFGIQVRLIQIDKNAMSYSPILNRMSQYNIKDYDKFVEYIPNGYKSTIPTNPGDSFMATKYFTAYMAHSTAALLNNPNILYFIEEYEPIYFPHDSDWIEASVSYSIPHFPIFSTKFLDQYFAKSKLGIYKWIKDKCPALDIKLKQIIQPAINAIVPFNPQHYTPNRVKHLLVYATPNEPRNVFSLVVAVLTEAVRLGIFGDATKWNFLAVGARKRKSNECLGNKKICLKTIHNLNKDDYYKLLSKGDVGLSISLSPNPSLVPLEFAASGMVTVTNSFESTTLESFEGISDNIIVVDPYLENLVEGLRKAVNLSEDINKRNVGSKISWPRDWSATFQDEVFLKVKSWMKTRDPVNQLACAK